MNGELSSRVVITGLLNTTNTIATLKGAEDIYEKETTARQYRASFLLTGSLSTFSGVLGLVPYAPYASSLGFLQSTGIRERAPFFVGSLLFILLGMVPQLSAFFSTIPHSVGNTVLFVAYLQLFRSAIRNIEGLNIRTQNRLSHRITGVIRTIDHVIASNCFCNNSTTCTTNPFEWYAHGNFGCTLYGVFVLSWT